MDLRLLGRRLACGVLVFAALLSVDSPTLGAPVAVVNPGFEDISGESPFNEFTFGPLNGWGLYEDPIGLTSNGDGPTFYIGTLTPFIPDPISSPGVYANFPAGAPEGQRVAIAFNFQGSDGIGEYGLEQTLGTTLQPYTTYTLQVEVGNIASAIAMSGQPFDLDGFSGYRVELLAGGMLLRADDNSLFGQIPEGEFATSTVTFTTSSVHPQMNQSLGIRLVNLNELDPVDPGADLEVDFDDVRLDASAVQPGDFDLDSDVDLADGLAWQRGESPIALGAADLSDWQLNLGFGAAPIGAAIPEPMSATLLGLAFATIGVVRRP